MKKILLSVGSILFTAAILAGGTGAFLADTETSTGNTFASGVIDLKIDNESYVTNDAGALVFSSSTSWALSPLAGKLFFNFLDVKPGDIGEDTISLHVNNNNAWACMAVNVTGTPENGQNEPEALVDTTSGLNDGELQNHLNFAFWADDGDNVYEQGERVFKQGLAKDIFNGQNWALADSVTNIWATTTAPIPGNTVRYIGKAWCFGSTTPNALAQDGKGKVGNNGPLVRGTGFQCSGTTVGNIVQSDGIKADVSFSVAQSRNNAGFICGGVSTSTQPTSTSTLFADTFNDYRAGQKCSEGDPQDNWDDEGEVDFQKVAGRSGIVANLDADHNSYGTDHKEVLISGKFNTMGYHDITLKYDRKTDDTDAPSNPVGPQTLTVEYTVNGGASWTTLETVTGESDWTTKTFSLSPTADNKTHVRVRFSLVGQNGTNHAYLDNVSVIGVTP